MQSVDASFVPPEQFAVKRWWKPVRPGFLWFYHSPAPYRGAAFMRDYSTVDPHLRPTVKFLHSIGIPTLPSCEGHWPMKKWAQRCYQSLAEDAYKIRGGGLTLEDVETGARIKYEDPYYELPWFSWQDFYEELLLHAGGGYLSFLLPPGHAINYLVDELRSVSPGVRVTSEQVGQRLHCVIRVRTRSPMAQHACWAAVQRVLSRAR